MEKWELRILSWYIYFLMMITLSLGLLSLQYDRLTIWMIAWIFVSVIPIFLLLQEPYRSKMKSWMETKGIRFVHLWIGLTIAYYGVVGAVKLLT